MLIRHGCQAAEIKQQRPVAIESDDLAVRQRQSQAECHRRGESKVLEMVIAGMWSQRLPFMAYGAEVRDHKFVAEVRRNRLKTIVSFHRLPKSLLVQDDRRGPAGRARKHLTVTDGRTNIVETADLLI